MKSRRCVICKYGKTQTSLVTVTLKQDEYIVIFKGISAEVCDNCGEYYLSDTVTEQVLKPAEIAVNNGAEVEILPYVAQDTSTHL
jgi:YgiT-type zinc finger domain-containing protein